MSTSNLLEPLVSVIDTIKQRIKDHGPSLRENETRTRVALIDPLLEALGWDVSDPRLVTLENPTEPGRVDYALLSGGEERPKALVEAKRLGTNLQSHRSQMVNYAVTQGIGYAGLTDGNVWEFYEVFKPTALSEKKLLDIVIADAPAIETALKMLLLWQPNLADGAPVDAVLPIVGLPDDAPRHNTPTVTDVEPPPPDVTPPPEEGNWVPLSDFVAKSNSKPPARIRFGSDIIYELPRWRSIIDVTTRWLFDTGKLTLERVPLVYGDRGGRINITPTRDDGTNFSSSYQVPSQPIYVNAHGNAPTIVRRAKGILVALEVDPSDVYVEQQ